jgi:hypothetical protein
VNEERISRLKRGLELALNQEWPQLDRTCRHAAQLDPVPIASADADERRIVATVATDGGESRLCLDPIRINVIRVADSEGQIYFEEFIPQSLRPEEIIRFFFSGDERLQRLLKYLGLAWDDLLPRTDYQKSHLVGMLRELLEWAATLRLAAEKRPMLILRDGLLRSILLPDQVFLALKEKLTDLTTRNRHLLAGVAKRAAVISYLSVALGLRESFTSDQPAYVEVGTELEEEASPSQYRWMGQRCMGQLFVARLDRGEGVPLIPVDMASWQMASAKEALSLLCRSAHASFPLRGYPQELMMAHQHACLSEFETQMLEGLLVQHLSERNPAVARQVHQLKLLGRRLIEEIPDGIQ